MLEAKAAVPESSMKLIAAWRKRQALRSYVRRLPLLLTWAYHGFLCQQILRQQLLDRTAAAATFTGIRNPAL